MSKELFIKLSEELGRDPTDDEMADATAEQIDEAHERRMQEQGSIVVLPRDKAMKNFEALMNFQYGNAEESEKAWNELKEAKKQCLSL